jgi:hypothetical protein
MQANKEVNSQRCKQPQDQANMPNQPIEQTNICSEPLIKKPTQLTVPARACLKLNTGARQARNQPTA